MWKSEDHSVNVPVYRDMPFYIVMRCRVIP